MSLKYGILLLAAAQCIWAAEPAQVAAPRLGFVPDPGSHRIVPIDGIPGAAVFGQPVAADPDAAGVAVAPGQNFSLLFKNGELMLLRFGEPQALEVIDAVAAGRILFGPSGATAAIYDRDAGQLRVITGLPGSPEAHTIDVPEPCDALAVGDGADVLAAGNSVWLLRPASAPVALAVPGPVSAAAFARHTDEALVAGGGQLMLVRLLPEGPRYHLLTTYSDSPVAVAFSSDSSRAIAVTAAGDIRIFTLDGSELPGLSCHCAATGLYQLNGNSIFRLNEYSAGPLWLLEAGTNPRLWFVPPEVAR